MDGDKEIKITDGDNYHSFEIHKNLLSDLWAQKIERVFKKIFFC